MNGFYKILEVIKDQLELDEFVNTVTQGDISPKETFADFLSGTYKSEISLLSFLADKMALLLESSDIDTIFET